ncbi:hypothetical protein V6N12_003374 [Hibiscus sabdariffa]|uniref:DUF4283 domain-containing protein n=1 Tax=Hibiscus sabdariffa TaxID=183260 RepID=A0ABR2B5W8_9ROSI
MITTFPESRDSPLNPRKHRRLDDEPPDSSDPRGESDKALPTIPKPVDAQEEEVLDEDEIEILDGDVQKAVIDGIINIEFSERIQDLAIKSLDQTILVKLLGQRIGYNTLRSKLYDLWKPSQAFRLMDIENDYFLVPIKSRSDFLHAVTGDAYGPWMVVERRQRCTPVKQVPPKVNHATSNVVASRFNPISDENLSEHTTDTDVPPRSHASVVAAKGKGVAPHTIRTKKTKSGTSVRKPLSVVNGSSVFHFSSNASSSRPVQPLDRHHHSAVVIPDNDDSSPPINVSSPDVIKCATRHDSMEQDKENHSLPPMMCDNTITTFDPTVLLNTVQ